MVDVVGNFCFVHPAKAGISSNLNIITDKGNIYSFTLQDVSSTSATPDLKVLVEPADRSSIVAASGPPQFVPAAQLEQSKAQLSALQSHVNEAWRGTAPCLEPRSLTEQVSGRGALTCCRRRRQRHDRAVDILQH